ncbi:hypothetical protein ACI8AA_14665 [Geodermatophilus sp. SYSU D01180]
MGWELVGGHPAPGSPDAVRSAASAMAQVAELAGDARHVFSQSAGRLDPSVWRGSAADAFRADIDDLPDRLREVSDSHRKAAAALRRFGDELEDLRFEADGVLRQADQADADRRQARQRRDAAENELESLRGRKRGASRDLTALQSQRACAVDPAQAAAMQQPLTSAQSRLNRLSADVRAAEDTVRRHERAIEDAEERLRRAVRRAQDIAGRVAGAVGNAVRDLQAAEQAAHLPGWWERQWTDANVWLDENAERWIRRLEGIQSVLSFAAMVFPPFAPAFTVAALALGGAAFVLSVAKVAASDEGFSGANVLDLGVKFIGLAAGATAAGAARNLGSAAKLAAAGDDTLAAARIASANRLTKVGEWLGGAEDFGKVGHGFVEGGVAGGATAVGAYVVGKGVTYGGSRLLREGLDELNETRVAGPLKNISRSLAGRNPDGTNTTVSLSDLPNVQGLQSLLGTGRVHPGNSLPGLTPGVPRDDINRAMSDQALDQFTREAIEAPAKWASEQGVKLGVGAAVDLLDGPDGPELEIELPASSRSNP